MGSEELVVEAGHRAASGKAHEQRGAFAAAANEYDLALASLAAAAPSELLVHVLRWRGNASLQVGGTIEAETWYRKSQDLAESLSYVAGQAHALNCEAAVAQRLGDLDRAERLYGEAVQRAARAGEETLQGIIAYNLGVLSSIRGDFDAAAAHYWTGLSVLERVGESYQVPNVLNNLGILYSRQGDFERAEEVFQRGLLLARSRADELVEGVIQRNRAEMLCAMERWDEADAACERALILADRRTDPLRRAEALKTRAVIQHHGRSFAAAERTLAEAKRLAGEANDALLVSELLREVGRLCAVRGETDRARAAWHEALEGFVGLGARRDASEVEAQLAALAA